MSGTGNEPEGSLGVLLIEFEQGYAAMSDDTTTYWEGSLRRSEERLKNALGPVRKDAAADVVLHKQILRQARLRAEIPVCWGSFDCVATTPHHCETGKHEMCEKHSACVLCTPVDI